MRLTSRGRTVLVAALLTATFGVGVTVHTPPQACALDPACARPPWNLSDPDATMNLRESDTNRGAFR